MWKCFFIQNYNKGYKKPILNKYIENVLKGLVNKLKVKNYLLKNSFEITDVLNIIIITNTFLFLNLSIIIVDKETQKKEKAGGGRENIELEWFYWCGALETVAHVAKRSTQEKVNNHIIHIHVS